MFQNNLIYFLLNIIVITICLSQCYLVSFITGDTDLNNYNKLVELFAVVTPLCLYIVLGFLSNFHKTTIKNLFSFSLIGAFGVIIWLVCYISSPNNTNWYGNSGAIGWLFFQLYNIGSIPLVSLLEKLKIDIYQNTLWSVVLVFVPTFLLWIGLEMRILLLVINEKYQLIKMKIN